MLTHRLVLWPREEVWGFPLTPALSPSEGERVPEGRVRGNSQDSRGFLASEGLRLKPKCRG